MSMYLPSDPGTAIDVATGPDGRAIGLIFSKLFSKRRHFTDGMNQMTYITGRLT